MFSKTDCRFKKRARSRFPADHGMSNADLGKQAEGSLRQ
jgi:hypothetical protein